MAASSVRFLTPEWVAALDEVAARSTELTEATRGLHLVVEQAISEGPGNDAGDAAVRYRMEFRDGSVRFRWGPADDPDVTLVQSRDAAVRMSRGTLNAQRAFVSGLLRVRGDIGKLTSARDVLARLDADVFAEVRGRTDYG